MDLRKRIPKKLIWVDSPGRYTSGQTAKIAHITIGSIFYDGATVRTEPNKYKATFNLPGYRQPKSNFLTQEEAKEWVEALFKVWIEKIME